ncbi:MAG TPA: hypothetical protein VGE09_05770, partial [Pseudoxanthomonas sp.]
MAQCSSWDARIVRMQPGVQMRQGVAGGRALDFGQAPARIRAIGMRRLIQINVVERARFHHGHTPT